MPDPLRPPRVDKRCMERRLAWLAEDDPGFMSNLFISNLLISAAYRLAHRLAY